MRKNPYCPDCGVLKTPENTTRRVAGDDRHLANRCRKCYNLYRQRILRDAKDLVLAHYGAYCQCCGEDNPAFLTVDHVDGNGAAHRKQTAGTNIHHWLVNNDFPEGFQILCWNCNCAKHQNGGICPHERQLRLVIGG